MSDKPFKIIIDVSPDNSQVDIAILTEDNSDPIPAPLFIIGAVATAQKCLMSDYVNNKPIASQS